MSDLLDGNDLMGVVGGCLVALCLVPQVWKALQTKSTEDISYAYQGIYIVGIILLNAYALILGLWPIYTGFIRGSPDHHVDVDEAPIQQTKENSRG